MKPSPSSDGPVRKLHRLWGSTKVGTRRHRLWLMTATIVALWCVFALHVLGIVTLRAGSGFLLTIIGEQHPVLRPFIGFFAGFLALLLVIEWRGIMNAITERHAPLHKIERRQLYIAHRHQALTTVLLTLTLLMFLLQMVGAQAESTPDVAPSSTNTELATTRVLAPPRSAGTVRTVRLPSTLRRKITRYTYTEHRQWQIAADPPPAGSFSISGIVYAGEGTSPFGAGTTIAISHNGGTIGTTVTGAGGQFTFANIHMTGGTIISIFIKGAVQKAAVVTLASGGSMTGVNLYQSHLIVRSDSGSVALSNANLAIADNSGDTDLTVLYDITAGNNLTVKSGYTLTVWPNSYYQPSANVNTIGDIKVRGTFIGLSNNINLSGSWIKYDGGTFIAGSSLVKMSGTNQTLSGSNTFYNFMKSATGAFTLTFGAGTTQQFNGTMTLNGVSGGRLSLRSSIAGTRAFVRPVGTRVVSYLDVQDNQNLDATAIGCFTGCIDSGNNILWLFSGGPGGAGDQTGNGDALSPLLSSDYKLRPDVVDSGGADWSKSGNYRLSDSIGEAVIGHGAANEYNLDSGYRQPSAADIISLSCSPTAALGTVVATGQRTASGTCIVLTDAFNGYQLSWRVRSGSGGALTGYLISQNEDFIGPFTPPTPNVPATWSVAGADSEWGGRLRSSSTDTAAEWGIDGVSDKWLNVGTGSTRVIASRNSATPLAGSVQIVQFRSEIGGSHFQASGTYQATVTFTVVGL